MPGYREFGHESYWAPTRLDKRRDKIGPRRKSLTAENQRVALDCKSNHNHQIIDERHARQSEKHLKAQFMEATWQTDIKTPAFGSVCARVFRFEATMNNSLRPYHCSIQLSPIVHEWYMDRCIHYVYHERLSIPYADLHNSLAQTTMSFLASQIPLRACWETEQCL